MLGTKDDMDQFASAIKKIQGALKEGAVRKVLTAE
jgi:hypothetical protein